MPDMTINIKEYEKFVYGKVGGGEDEPDVPFLETAIRQRPRFNRFLIKDPNTDELLDALGDTDVAIYQRMLRDDTVKAALQRKCSGLLQMGWEVHPPADPTPEEEHVTEYVQWMLDNFLTHNRHDLQIFSHFSQVLLDLCDALVAGYSILELTIAVIDRGKWLGKTGIHKLVGLDPVEYGFKQDDFRNVESIVTTIDGFERRFGTNKFIIFPYNARYGDPHGNSDLRAAHRGFKIRDDLFKWWLAATEKLGAGFLVGKYKQGSSPAEIQKMLTMLQRIKNDAVTVIPDSASIEIPNTGNLQGTFDTLNTACERMIIQSIEGAFLHANEGSDPGKRGSSAVHESTAVRFIWFLGIQIEPIINNQLIRRMVDFNFGPQDRYPQFKFVEPGDTDITVALSHVDSAVALGVPVGKSYVYSITGIPAPKDDEPLVEKPEVPTPGLPFSEKFAELVNKAGFTVKETLDRVVSQGRKFSKEESNFVDRSSTAAYCGRCQFWNKEFNTCQVVEGNIGKLANSDFFIQKIPSAFNQDLEERDRLTDNRDAGVRREGKNIVKHLEGKIKEALKSIDLDAPLEESKARDILNMVTIDPELGSSNINLSEKLWRSMLHADLVGRVQANDSIEKLRGNEVEAFAAISPLFGDFTPDEAFAWVSKQIPITRAAFDALALGYQENAFTLARATNIEQIERVRNFIESSIRNGGTRRQFIQAFEGEFTEGYLDTVFSNNTRNAYEAGRKDLLLNADIDDVAPTLTYTTVGDARVRPLHAALDGFTAPRTDPVWTRIWPPIDHNCRCTVVSNLPDEAMVSDSGHLGWSVNPPFA